MVDHLGSLMRSPGISRVAYWMVGHLGSQVRSPGTSRVAYWSCLGTYQVAAKIGRRLISNFLRQELSLSLSEPLGASRGPALKVLYLQTGEAFRR